MGWFMNDKEDKQSEIDRLEREIDRLTDKIYELERERDEASRIAHWRGSTREEVDFYNHLWYDLRDEISELKTIRSIMMRERDSLK